MTREDAVSKRAAGLESERYAIVPARRPQKWHIGVSMMHLVVDRPASRTYDGAHLSVFHVARFHQESKVRPDPNVPKMGAPSC